ncbi:hypothetical protein G4G28_13740 [Massilia sp. Dwa41.01b]|uniref:hypothetical protein n=1 Tax=Massilia sp. Dwa41.01b TaxID=2709302 RepID=UPI001601F0C8|nr:hypothetical protein [Massilia sp. Dwa41.01b]QNA89262.1 hypothetical protein G4G28_13740 [Massilia sp. Dwa41.01b]
MKRALLSLLVAGACAHVQAASVSCGPSRHADPAALTRADAALKRPGPTRARRELLLAEALADSAGALARHPGNAAATPKDRPGALDLLGRARTIWAAAQPNAELASRLWQRGRRDLLAHHCPLALGELESALGAADKAGDTRLAESILRDLARVAGAMRDDAVLKPIAPRLSALLEADSAPLAQDRLDGYLAAAGYYYRAQDNTRAETLLKRLREQARTANPQDGALLRRLDFELASVLYAQLRYKEAQALSAPLQRPPVEAPTPYLMHKQLEQDMAARVRAGDLAGAATLGREALARYTAERARADASMTAAAASQEAALAQGRQIDAAAAAAKLARSKADVSSLRTMAADIQSDLGEILHAQGQLDAALPLYETALRGYPAPEMVHVYKVNRILAAMGALYRTRGDTRALALQQQVHAALLPRLGKGPPRRHRRRRRNGGATPGAEGLCRRRAAGCAPARTRRAQPGAAGEARADPGSAGRHRHGPGRPRRRARFAGARGSGVGVRGRSRCRAKAQGASARGRAGQGHGCGARAPGEAGEIA